MPDFGVAGEFVEKTRNYATGPRGPRERSEDQKPWDGAFSDAMETTGFLHVQVTPGEVEDARKRVAAAARLYDRGTTEGEPTPGTKAGTVILSWKIRAVTPRPKKDTPASE